LLTAKGLKTRHRIVAGAATEVRVCGVDAEVDAERSSAALLAGIQGDVLLMFATNNLYLAVLVPTTPGPPAGNLRSALTILCTAAQRRRRRWRQALGLCLSYGAPRHPASSASMSPTL
jgi:hypothetical protein